MKQVLLGLALVITIACSTGCEVLNNNNCRSCNSCRGPIGCRPCKVGWQRGGTDYQRFLSRSGHHGRSHAMPASYGPSGPTTAQVAYPYYTTRGPRDFFVDNPPTIGN